MYCFDVRDNIRLAVLNSFIELFLQFPINVKSRLGEGVEKLSMCASNIKRHAKKA